MQQEGINERDGAVVAETQRSPCVPRESITHDIHSAKTLSWALPWKYQPQAGVWVCYLALENMHAGKVNQSAFISINHLCLPPFSCCVKWWKKLLSCGDWSCREISELASGLLVCLLYAYIRRVWVCLLCAARSWGKRILIWLLSAFDFIVMAAAK